MIESDVELSMFFLRVRDGFPAGGLRPRSSGTLQFVNLILTNHRAGGMSNVLDTGLHAAILHV